MNSRNLVNLARMEREMTDQLLPVDFAQPHHRENPLPDYVSPTDGVSDVGALSASAVVQMYEQAAVAMEELGEQQKLVVGRCEEVIADAHRVMAEAKAAAEELREEGKRKFAEIERYALLTQNVRETCAAMRAKVVAEVKDLG